MSFGVVGTDVHEKVNWERLRRERYSKALSKLKESGLGALLLMYEENIRYVTATHGPMWTRDKPGLRYALLLKDGDIVHYEQGDNRYHTMKECPWLKRENVKYAYAVWIKGASGPATSHQANKFATDIKKVLKDHGATDLPLGVDFIDLNMARSFQQNNIEYADGQTAMHEARAVKTKDEVACSRIAATIADGMHYKLSRMLKPGITENMVIAKLMNMAYSTPGVDHVTTLLCSSGPNSWPNRRSFSDRMLRIGDLVLVDIVISWNGYHTCYYRTYCCGKKPTPEQKDYYQRALDWLYEAIRAVRPGVTTKDIAEKFPSAKEAWGYDEEEEAAANLWGHGLGLSHYDLPVVSRIHSLDHPYPIKEGMVFALETQHGKMFEWGVRIEEMVTVTGTGYELLTRFPVEEITPAE